MRPIDKYPWGPKDELGDLIGQVPYPQPDPSLAGRIMRQLEPLQLNRWQRFMAWLRTPMTISLTPALVALLLMIVFLPGGLLVYRMSAGPESAQAVNPEKSRVPVVLNFTNASAQSVAVMGSFNNWDPKGYEMTRQQNSGKWFIELRLSPGRHDYVFLVNGDKVSSDPDADLTQKDEYGNRNSVRFVKEQHDQQI